MLQEITDIFLVFFFFNDTAPPEIYTLSLHDALPIYHDTLTAGVAEVSVDQATGKIKVHNYWVAIDGGLIIQPDRKSTRLNSSHLVISYAVFCLKKNINRTYISDVMTHHPVRLFTFLH